MAKEIFIRVIATVIAMLIVITVVAYYECEQRKKADAAGKPHDGCGCGGACKGKQVNQPQQQSNSMFDSMFSTQSSLPATGNGAGTFMQFN